MQPCSLAAMQAVRQPACSSVAAAWGNACFLRAWTQRDVHAPHLVRMHGWLTTSSQFRCITASQQHCTMHASWPALPMPGGSPCTTHALVLDRQSHGHGR
eukprot:364647-Chlamydomonas_euryale.AAC.10